VAQRKILCHSHNGVVDRAVTVRVVFTDHITHNAGRFLVGAVPVVVQLMHSEQHAPVHRFQAVPGIWQGPAHDHAHGVIEIAAAHLFLKTDGQGFFGKLGHGNRKGSKGGPF